MIISEMLPATEELFWISRGEGHRNANQVFHHWRPLGV